MARVIARDPDPVDPDSIDHPSHREQWLALARALGRLDARRDFEAMQGKGKVIEQAKAGNAKPDT